MDEAWAEVEAGNSMEARRQLMLFNAAIDEHFAHFDGHWLLSWIPPADGLFHYVQGRGWLSANSQWQWVGLPLLGGPERRPFFPPPRGLHSPANHFWRLVDSD